MYRTPPPSYESVMGDNAIQDPFVPPRYNAPSEGRNSIIYSQLPPLYDTTKLFLIDNKSADIESLNYQNDKSNYLTSVVQNSEFSVMEAGTQSINLDERSRWGGHLKTVLHIAMPNITEYMFSNSFRAKLMVARENKQPVYEWVELRIPEGNFSLIMTLELMNDAIINHYLAVGRQRGVKEEDIGVKFDTRNFRLGFDPEVGLVTPGAYTYEAFHPDVILLPGCAVDFTKSRLSNLLGIRKKYPYQRGFIITYEDLKGGNIPALADIKNPVRGDVLPSKIFKPLQEDEDGRSYHVGEDPEAQLTDTAYRSWYLSYNYGPADGAKSWTILVSPDVTCGVEQIYWSLPNLTLPPVSFRDSNAPQNYPVVGTELLPMVPRTYYNPQAVYAQLIRERTSQTHVFNRFPNNQILIRPPAPTITTISENVPAITDHGTIPLKNNISGVQRVTLTDARRRLCPYVTKSLGIISPKVLSSRTF
ncbi:penton base [Egyptian fruit bat adenovirus]|uniref:Penton protein n=1 Tax=Egyptian fruit bat adenovirus TaxID=2849732 RepID=A0A344X9U6_9ADEN|nr:penton base [Rousettus aegyptiacus adenovirus]AXE75628.1 penton base [Egyptian fruit bat adenovirus]